MRLSSVARLYRVRLRSRLAPELFAVLGIAIGVSLLFASQVADTSLNGSVRQLTSGVVGQMRFQLAARDSQGFDERLVAEVARLSGVQGVAPVLEQNANVVGRAGTQSVDLVGTDPRMAHIGGRLARRVGALGLGRANVLALPAPIAQKIGASSLQPIKLQLGSRSVAALLVPELIAGDIGFLGQTPVALAPLRTVQRLTEMPGRLTSIYIRSSSRLDRSVRAELRRLAGGRLNVRPADFNTALFARAARPVNQSTSLFSALSALIGFLFAFNALLLTVPQRRSLIEDLSLDGYTRRMIIEVLLFDALTLGALASALGLLLGEVLSAALFNTHPGYLSFAFPIGTERIVTLSSVAAAVVGGMLAACAGVFAPLRAEILERRRRSGTTETRRVRRRAWWLLGAAAVCAAGTTVVLFAAPQAALVGVFSLTAALVFCLPAALGLAVRAGQRLQQVLSGVAAYLALLELRAPSNRSRSLAIAATGAIAVFGSVSIQGARGSLQRGLDASARGIDDAADIWVTAAGVSNSFATTPFGEPSSTALTRLPGVRSVRTYRGSFLDWGDRRLWVVAPPRADAQLVAPSQVVDGDAVVADARLKRHGWLVLSRAIASERGLRVGQAFTLPSSQPTSFRVAALSTNLGWPPGAIVMNADDYARAWGDADPSAYLIGLAPGASPTSVVNEIKLALGPRSGLHVERRDQRERLHYSQAAQGLSRLSEIRSLVLIAAVLAMAAAMGAMIWQRRARLADMKVDGFSTRVLWHALLWESALLLGVGCSLGAVFGLYGQLLLGRALSVVNGFPVIESTPVPAAVGNFALITAVAVAIVAAPGYLAARVPAAVGRQE